jgi:hypothetical protein
MEVAIAWSATPLRVDDKVLPEPEGQAYGHGAGRGSCEYPGIASVKRREDDVQEGDPPEQTLRDIERTAVDLARLAGAEIVRSPVTAPAPTTGATAAPSPGS